MGTDKLRNGIEQRSAEPPAQLLDPLLREKREEILRIAAKHGALNVRVFGSRARGEARPDSDVDLLVEMGPNHSPWFPAHLIADLEELLGCKVHVGSERGLHPYVRERMAKDVTPL